MSKIRHDGSIIRTFGVTFHSSQTLQYSVFGWDQLIYAMEGVLAVQVSEGVWTLPAHRALWVPDGVEHSIHIAHSASMRSLYFRAGSIRHLPRRSSALNVSPLLRELISACIELGALSSRKPAHRRLAAVILDQMKTIPSVPLQLLMPKDPRAVAVAVYLRGNPAASLSQAAAHSGSSLRTLERLFESETRMPLGAWARRLRIQVALEFMASGSAVGEAAMRCGYNSPSAFISMFRRELGVTPGAYLGTSRQHTQTARARKRS
ncbi:MAG: AraC family transcriptional regulator [Acidobacteria bacterium]|nr:AraC family transcriptional regulator [Acidobacteriota bacterium]